MEPLLIASGSRERASLSDLALDLARKSAGFRRSLPPALRASLADLVRAMNCYYSNLIEGHDTHPVDIERALNNDFSKDAHQRDLQLEAKAHIAVQQWIDSGGLTGGQYVSWVGMCEIHRRFCELLPEDLLWVEDPFTKERVRVVPGELRRRDVQVGTHVAALLAECDLPRRNDFDGRGPLSEGALVAFTRFFLQVSIDQVDFMESLVQPDRLRARILLWADEEIRVGGLPAKSGSILEAALYRGELARGDVDAIVGTGERQARRIVAALLEKKALVSRSSRAPLRLAFPAHLASRWMPGLFPEKAG